MIFNQIKLGYPSLWIKSEDVHKTTESIVNHDFRTYFMIDPVKGFSEYVNGTWKPLLIPILNPETGEEVPKVTFDIVVALEFIKNYKEDSLKTFVFQMITNPESFLQMFAGIFVNAVAQYRDAFWSNDNSLMPTQYVIVSPFDIPQDYVHVFKLIEAEFPTREELTYILSHVSSQTDGHFFSKNDLKSILDSGIGLNESDFINIVLQSIVEKGKVSPEYIYEHKMSSLKKHGILQIIKPKITFDNIGGLDLVKDLIARNANLWHNPDQAAKFGIAPIRRMLMVGIPGTGKSAICEATANELGLDLARTGVSQVMNSFIGQSEQNMRAVFQQISAMAPLCVWIDEFGRDLSGGQSSSHVDGGTTDRVHGEFLTGLQELPDNVFLMCAANQLEHLKPEMLRADRFDKILFVGLPSFMERQDIFNIYLSDIQTDHVFDLDILANATQYFTGAEIKSLINEAKFYVSSSELRPVNTKDIVSFVPKMRNILWNKSRTMIQDLYKTALEQWDWASTTQFEDAKIVLNPTKFSVSTPKIPVKR